MYEADFARVYDHLMDDFDYPRRAAYYLTLARRVGEVKRACECACGTGSMSIEWARAGLMMTGVDLSEEMLRVAQEKARRAGVMMPFVRQDMRKLSLPRPVDAVFCPCDGLNYLLEESDVRAFFGRAHAFIKPGGALVADLSTKAKLCRMAEETYFEDRSDVSYFWRSRLEDARVHMELTFFVRQPGGLYRRFDEAQTQRAHDLDFIRDAAKDAGFSSCEVFGDLTLAPPEPGCDRVHMLCAR